MLNLDATENYLGSFINTIVVGADNIFKIFLRYAVELKAQSWIYVHTDPVRYLDRSISARTDINPQQLEHSFEAGFFVLNSHISDITLL